MEGKLDRQFPSTKRRDKLYPDINTWYIDGEVPIQVNYGLIIIIIGYISSGIETLMIITHTNVSLPN